MDMDREHQFPKAPKKQEVQECHRVLQDQVQLGCVMMNLMIA
jgi:hypothetical protein